MALLVHKYGGTSMGSTERIRNVAKRVAKWVRAGHQIVVVPSAMSGETNRLLGLAKELQPAQVTPTVMRELDAIAATGEQVSVGLLSIALQTEGLQAVSYAGWQLPIATDSSFTKARIRQIDDGRVRTDLAAGKVVVIAGFQGVDPSGNVTTLGRGGSDTSAVAVAAAMKADECLIYTDVDGVYKLPGWAGELRVQRTVQGGVPLAWLGQLELRERTGGEQFQAGIGRPPRSLKKQYQSAGLAAWHRDGPLLYSGGQLVFVPGLGIDARMFALPGQAQVTLQWQGGPSED